LEFFREPGPFFSVFCATCSSFPTERLRVSPAGLPVEGMISSAEREFPFTGRVAWSLPGDQTLHLRGRMGVKFIRINPAFRGS
jgi:hypothetical protein